MAVIYPSVSITNSISVYSNASFVSPKTLILSNLDRQCPDLMYTVFFYKSSCEPDLCFDSVFSQIKAGLEATLSIWYPAAGRLSPDVDGKLNILCNNGGAVLVQAVARAKISELGDLSVYTEFFENLVFKPVISHGDFTQMPLVVAQVTKFECGGYSVGVGMSHSVLDGVSAFEFLRAWASLSQARSSSLLYKPVHERSRTSFLIDHHNHLSSNPTAIDHLYQLITQANPNQETDLVYKTFHLSAEMIESLKKKVREEEEDEDEDEDRLCFSTFEVLAAHLWKVRTKALGLEADRNVCLQFAVDARNRTSPPLPRGFAGNAYVLASLLSSAGELEQLSHHNVINLIKQAKTRVNHDYIATYIHSLRGPPESLPPLPELTVISDWTRLPFHKVDFLGREAAYASPLQPPVAQVAYFMQNPSDSTAIDVRIGLIPRIVPEFSHHFININI